MQVNIADAIKQLRTIDPRPEARFDLASIDKETGLRGKTFTGAELDRPEFAAWVKRENAKRNIYVTANEARAGTPHDIKLSDKDVGTYRVFLADIDLNRHEDDTRTKGEVLADLASSDCPPSMVVDSGNGLWPVWVLETPATVESIDGASQAAGLIERFKSDVSCKEPSRLMRLAGTINRKAGFANAMARVVTASGPRTTPEEIAAWCPPVVEAKREHRALPVSEVSTEAERVQEAIRYLLHDAPESVQFQHGDDHLYEAACQLKNIGIEARPSVELLAEFYNPFKAHPEWPRAKLHEKVKSAFKNEKVIFGRNVPINPETEFEPVEQGPFRLPINWATNEFLGNIPDREWLLGKFLVRRSVSSLVSPGGTGKTTLAMMIGVAVATGRDDILGFKVHERTRTLIWNQEDDLDEMRRRLRAVMQFYEVSDSDMEIEGRPGVALASGVERPLLLAKRGNSGTIVAGPDAHLLAEDLKNNGFGVVILDPLIELHQGNENDNGEMGAVGRVLRDNIAVAANCAALVNHHTRKPPQASANGFAGDMDVGRGAGSLNGVYRVAATMFNVDQKTAKEYGIPEDKRHLYVRFDDAKANMSLKSSEPIIFRREGVRLPESVNDEVGVLALAPLSKKGRTSDTLLSDVLAFLEGKTEAWVTDVADKLIGGSFYASDDPKLLAKRISDAVRNAETTNGWMAETVKRKGFNGLRVRLTFRETDLESKTESNA